MKTLLDVLWIKEESVFRYETKSLVYLRRKVNCNANLSGQRIDDTSMTEHELHFWRTSLDFECLLDSINYSTLSQFLSEYAVHKNLICNVQRLASTETVFKADRKRPGKRSIPQREKKPMKLMQIVMQKRTKSGALVSDPCVGTGATAIASFLKNRAWYLLAATGIVISSS